MAKLLRIHYNLRLLAKSKCAAVKKTYRVINQNPLKMLFNPNQTHRRHLNQNLYLPDNRKDNTA